MHTDSSRVRAADLPLTRRLWLREIGVDRRLLEAFTPPPPPAARALSGTRPESGPPRDAGRLAVEPPVMRPPAADVGEHSVGGRVADDAPRPPRPRPAPVAPAEAAPGPTALDTQALKGMDLAALAAQAAQCHACGLADVRGLTVFGSGLAQQPDWFVLGEAPTGEDERAGVPFQGRQGALLQAMLASVGIDAQALYFTHLVKCRPLGNRPPSTEEIDACRALLLAQMREVRPQRLLLLGRTAVAALLGPQASFEQWQGRYATWQWPTPERPDGWPADGLPLLVTHHPGALLMRPQHKQQAWRDLVLARQLMASENG